MATPVERTMIACRNARAALFQGGTHIERIGKTSSPRCPQVLRHYGLGVKSALARPMTPIVTKSILTSVERGAYDAAHSRTPQETESPNWVTMYYWAATQYQKLKAQSDNLLVTGGTGGAFFVGHWCRVQGGLYWSDMMQAALPALLKVRGGRLVGSGSTSHRRR